MDDLLPTFAQSHKDIEPLLNQIHHADCFDLLGRIPDDSVDMVLADLPYGTTQAKWDSPIPFDKLIPELKRVIKPKRAIVATASEPFKSTLVSAFRDWFRYEWIWHKHRKSNFLNAKKMPLLAHESIPIFSDRMPIYYPQMRSGKTYKGMSGKGSVLYGGYNSRYYERSLHYPDTVLDYPHDPELSIKLPNHPTQKPVALFEYLIKTYTQEGEIVLDMTCGSGTTAIAARKCGRQFICGDLELEYVKLARKRLQDTDPYQDMVLANGMKQRSLFRDIVSRS